MVSAIQLGNVFSSGDKKILTGGNSGLDIESLINSLVEAKRIPAVALEAKVELNANKSSALTELKTILDNFKKAADFLRNPPGVQNADKNLFKYRATVVSSDQGQTASDYMTATALPGAPVGSHQITITSIAKATIQASDTITVVDGDTPVTAATSTAGMFTAGTMTLNNGVTVELEEDDTLNEIAQKINAVKDDSGVQATVIKVATNSFKLVLQSTKTGTANQFDVNVAANTGAGGTLENIGFATTQAADDAVISVDGVTNITRSSNTIDDVISNVTLNLKQPTVAMQELTVGVQPDSELIQQGIINFVDAYNEFKIFAAKQQQLDESGKPVDTAYLSSSNTLKTLINRIGAELSRTVDGITGGDPDALADLGITFSDYQGDKETPFVRNILTVDSDKLLTKIQSDFDAVRKVFEFDMVSDSTRLQVFSRTNGLNVSGFTLNIDTGTDTYTADYIDANGDPQTVELEGSISGGFITLKGKQGTVLDGLVLLYNGTGSDTVEVSITQGIGDRLYNTLNDALSTNSGLVQVELESLGSSSDRYQKEIERIDEQIERFRDQLIERFSNLESAIQAVNSLLQALDAQAQARANN